MYYGIGMTEIEKRDYVEVKNNLPNVINLILISVFIGVPLAIVMFG